MTQTPKTPSQPAEPNRRGSPWRDPPAATVNHAGDEHARYETGAGLDDATPSFMSALRRFRSRHGLSPVGQTPLLADTDLDNLRAIDCERPGLDIDDIATGTEPASST
jgi:hypothetical protein